MMENANKDLHCELNLRIVPKFCAILKYYEWRWSNTINKLLQFATQQCCVASCKALVHVLQPTSNIVTQQFRCCKLKQYVTACWIGVYFFQQILQLATTKFCCVTMFEEGDNTCNNAFQLATQQCCPYYGASNCMCQIIYLYPLITEIC